jgi:transcriptional regulator with XRE-family HTH domain
MYPRSLVLLPSLACPIMSRKLQNYLRTYRKRFCLSQKEVAFLLGVKNGAKASRYERLQRVPLLETILAYEVIFKVPVRELFGGVFEKVNEDVIRRAKLLTRILQEGKADRATTRKLELLSAIIAEHQIHTDNS